MRASMCLVCVQFAAPIGKCYCHHLIIYFKSIVVVVLGERCYFYCSLASMGTLWTHLIRDSLPFFL